MGRELAANSLTMRSQRLWQHRGRDRRRRRESYTARHVVSSAPVRELVRENFTPAYLAFCMRAHCATATSSRSP